MLACIAKKKTAGKRIFPTGIDEDFEALKTESCPDDEGLVSEKPQRSIINRREKRCCV